MGRAEGGQHASRPPSCQDLSVPRQPGSDHHGMSTGNSGKTIFCDFWENNEKGV